MKHLAYILLAAIGLAVAAVGVQAQAEQAGPASGAHDNSAVTRLSEWHYAPIYEARHIRAKHLLGIEVFAPDDEEIGSVEDVIIEHGGIVAIIAEVGGVWDIGDVHIAVPWKDVELVDDGLAVPVREGNFQQYALYQESSYINAGYLQQVRKSDAARAQGAAIGQQCAQQADTGEHANALPRGTCAWRLTALIDDYVTLEDGAGSGILDDVFFSETGAIQAIVVEWAESAYGYGAYALPFDGYAAGRAWNPHDRVYVLPYGVDQIGTLEPFDYDRFNGVWD